MSNSGKSFDESRVGFEHYKRGIEAMERQNWDLASDSLRDAIRLIPERANWRQLWHFACCKRYHGNRTGARWVLQLKMPAIQREIRAAISEQDWMRADEGCMDGLSLNPWDVELNAQASHVLERQTFFDCAKYFHSLSKALRRENESD